MSKKEPESTHAETQLRKNEELLDDHHRSLKLFSRTRGEGIYGLLAVYDSMTFVIAIQGVNPLKMRRMVERLGQSLRWIVGQDGEAKLDSFCNQELFEEAYAFIEHACNYVDIADFYRMYGRGQVDVESPEPNTIKFVPKVSGCLDAFGMIEGVEHELRRGKQNINIREEAVRKLRKIFNQVPHRLVAGRVSPTSFDKVEVRSVVEAYQKIQLSPPFGLDTTTTLGGFTIGDVHLFWAGLYFWSQWALSRYLELVQKGTRQEECIPVQVTTRDEFFRHMFVLTGQDRCRMEPIFEAFSSYCGANGLDKNIDPSCRPIIRVGEYLTWSSRYVCEARTERNILRSLSRRGNPVVPNLIGGRESNIVTAVAKKLKKHGYRCKIDTEIDGNGESGQIDLLAWHPSVREQLLLIEIKSVLAPDEINEVNTLTTEMIKGQGQLRRCMNILDSVDSSRKAIWVNFVPWDEISTVKGLVLSGEGEPDSKYDQSDFPGMAATTFNTRLRRKDYCSPSAIVDAVRRRPWFAQLKTLPRIWMPVIVGSLVYELPTLELERGSHNNHSPG